MVSISHAFLPLSSLKCHNLAASHSSRKFSVFRPMFTFTHFSPCPLRDSKDFHVVISFFSHELATLARRRAMLNENLRFGISLALLLCVWRSSVDVGFHLARREREWVCFYGPATTFLLWKLYLVFCCPATHNKKTQSSSWALISLFNNPLYVWHAE